MTFALNGRGRVGWEAESRVLAMTFALNGRGE